MGRRDYLEAGFNHSTTPAYFSADELFRLGLNHATGRQATFDLVAAHKWFSIAAIRGSERAKDYRADIAQELSKVELRKAQREARKWLKTNKAN